MTAISNQRENINAVIDYLTSVKEYIEGTSTSSESFETFLENVSEVELEEYLLNNMANVPTFMESAIQETKNFMSSWRRDLAMRSMNRSDYFADHPSSIENDINYLRDLRELQSQYIRGRTPQQRS